MSDASRAHWLVETAQETPLHGWPYSAEDCVCDQFRGALRQLVETPRLLLSNTAKLRRIAELCAADEAAQAVIKQRRLAAAAERKEAA